MTFPAIAFTDPTSAQSALMNKATENGLSAIVLDGNDATVNAILANLFTSLPSGIAGALTPPAQEITEAGAIDLDAGYVALVEDAEGDYAITLAAPTAAQSGRVMVIEMTANAEGNEVTLDLENVVGGTDTDEASFDAAGEQLVLVAAGEVWVVLKENGVTLS